ncbi:MAG TPA: enoyl-CoA hydratase-related protein [Jatrophihabitans sp.]
MSAVEYEQIAYDLSDGIATITLSRPEKLNAYTRQMLAELLDAFDRVDADPAVRAVILTGAGRAFCAGADISDGTFFHYAQDEVHEDSGGTMALRIFNLLKPVIVAINGASAGVGATLPLACDMRLASRTATFTFPFTRIGIVPESASAWFLPRAVGLSQALEWTMTARRFGAEEALTAGLVRSVHEPEELLPAARALAAEIVQNTSPVSVALTRQMLWRLSGEPHPLPAHRIGSRAMQQRGPSADAVEGVAAFREKRAASFPGEVPADLPPFFPWWQDEAF